MTSLPLTIRPESPSDADAIERLHERAFGPGRFARSAYRLREGRGLAPHSGHTAHVGTLLVGSVRTSPILAGTLEAVMLGPLTVDPAFEKRGIGSALMQASIEADRRAGYRLVLLVGDRPYYGRFGFVAVPPGQLVLPGPVDPARFLALELEAGAMAAACGPVMPFRSRA